jgi:hypothetical protein
MTTDNTVTNDGGSNPPTPDPNAQQNQPAPEQHVPYSRLQEEIAKRQDMELQLQQMREQQLRMMAQPQPVYQPPQDTSSDEEDIDNLFVTQPRKAVNQVMSKREQALRAEAEAIARRTYYTETNKMLAMQRYPDLKNPNSDFFRKVGWYMQTHPEKFNDPEGILDACARVNSEMPSTPNQTQQQVSQRVVQQVAAAASQVSPSSSAPVTETTELDPQAQLLAEKLHIDPKKMADRLKNLTEEKGEYAPRPGKTGKAILNTGV